MPIYTNACHWHMALALALLHWHCCTGTAALATVLSLHSGQWAEEKVRVLMTWLLIGHASAHVVSLYMIVHFGIFGNPEEAACSPGFGIAT